MSLPKKLGNSFKHFNGDGPDILQKFISSENECKLSNCKLSEFDKRILYSYTNVADNYPLIGQQGLRLTTNVEGGESWIKCEYFRIGTKATDGQSIEELAANKTHLYNVKSNCSEKIDIPLVSYGVLVKVPQKNGAVREYLFKFIIGPLQTLLIFVDNDELEKCPYGCHNDDTCASVKKPFKKNKKLQSVNQLGHFRAGKLHLKKAHHFTKKEVAPVYQLMHADTKTSVYLNVEEQVKLVLRLDLPFHPLTKHIFVGFEIPRTISLPKVTVELEGTIIYPHIFPEKSDDVVTSDLEENDEADDETN